MIIGLTTDHISVVTQIPIAETNLSSFYVSKWHNDLIKTELLFWLPCALGQEQTKPQTNTVRCSFTH